jgi:hypothetical protein
MSDEPPDTYTWLLTQRDACPACGAPLAPDAPSCGVCGRSFMQLVRPAQRSAATMTLVGLFAFGLLGAVLALIGTLSQVLGVTPRANSPQVLRWLLIGCTGIGLLSAVMAWGYWSRVVVVFYVGAALVALVGVVGVAAAFLVRGILGLLVASGGVLLAIALLATHVAALAEFRGEWRRQTFPASASSGQGLYQEGRALYAAGLRFLAAQRWARAIGKEPGNAGYLYALGLVLAQLGHHQRALGQLERARRADPNNAHIRQSLEMIRQSAVGSQQPAGISRMSPHDR